MNKSKLYHKNGTIREEKFYQNDQLHRDDGPAVIIYNENGDIKTLNYYINGELSEGNIFN